MSTLQQQIQNLAEQLEQLATQIGKPNNEVNDTELDFIISQAQLNPFQEHLLQEHDEYVKSQYIKILLSIANQGKTYKLERYSIVAKIYFALGLSEMLETHIKSSHVLSMQDFMQFYMVLKENNLEEVFLLDSLMLLSLGNEGEVHEYVADLTANLNVTQDNFTRACQIIKAILIVDEDELRRLFGESRLFQNSAGHLLMAIKSSCSPIVYIEGNGRDIVNIEDYMPNKLILKNVVVEIPSNYVIADLELLELEDCVIKSDVVDFTIFEVETVRLNNIKFNKNKEIHSLNIQKCKDVTISNLELENLNIQSNYLFSVDEATTFEIKNTIFKSNVINHNNMFLFIFGFTQKKAGLIKVEKVLNIVQENNQLINCQIKTLSDSKNLTNLIFEESEV